MPKLTASTLLAIERRQARLAAARRDHELAVWRTYDLAADALRRKRVSPLFAERHLDLAEAVAFLAAERSVLAILNRTT